MSDNETETSAATGLRGVCELLSLDPSSATARILAEIVGIVKAHRVKRNITDWPFENFWGNPLETHHSKLLAYFINPNEQHGCGVFPLQKFLETLNIIDNKLPVDEHCKVTCEDGRIDVLVRRKRDDGTYAIIVENKVNGAQDQEFQLKRYVQYVLSHYNFQPQDIYVVYVPLTNDKDPDRDDLEGIKRLGVPENNYKKVTFETEISNWLKTVIDEWPQGKHEEMRANLSHYRDLIGYLNRAKKEREMSTNILKKLEEAENNVGLPKLSDVENCWESISRLRENMRQILRRRLCLTIKCLLKTNHRIDARFCRYQGEQRIDIDSPCTKDFRESLTLYITVNPAVSVGLQFPQDDWPLCLAYMRSGTPEEQNEISARVVSEAERHFEKNKVPGDAVKNYSYEHFKEPDETYRRCDEDLPGLAESCVNKLTEMHKSLGEQLLG